MNQMSTEAFIWVISLNLSELNSQISRHRVVELMKNNNGNNKKTSMLLLTEDSELFE